MYQDELASVGHRLFQLRRSYPSVVTIAGLAVIWATGGALPFSDALWNQVYLASGVLVAVSGLVVRAVAAASAARGTSGSRIFASEDAPGSAGEQAVAAELNQTGMYSLVRNPLYVGRILSFTGVALVSGSWVFGVVVYLVSFIIYERVAVYEEEFLRTEFPESHSAWAAEVRALLPRLGGWVAPKYPFWWKRMIWREVITAFDLILALALFDFARRGFAPSALDHDLFWVYALVAITLLRVTVGSLKRFTNYYADMT